MIGLTRKQAEVLRFVREYLAVNGFAPSLEEIASGTGLQSKSTAFYHMRELEDRGYLRRASRKRRSIEIVARGATIELSPQVNRLVDEYARRHRTTKQAAANELIAEYLAKVAA